mmetsp:Transcript_106010/g.257548  ORF Transcript_106010/g.257548 Transcript_106010/m.257548 type:complete len:598 (-) Transcript_106010:68-1861(-)
MEDPSSGDARRGSLEAEPLSPRGLAVAVEAGDASTDVAKQSAEPASATVKSLGPVYLSVFIDFLGLGLAIPVLPYLIVELGGTGRELGLLFSVFSLFQVVGSFLMGALSDRIGRRRAILLSIFGSAAGYAATGAAGAAESLAGIFIARCLSGLSGSSASIANAYIADTVSPDRRPKFLGLIGASVGTAFTLGPGVGAALAAVMEPASVFYVAAAFSTLALLWAYRRLGESRRVDWEAVAARKAEEMMDEEAAKAPVAAGDAEECAAEAALDGSEGEGVDGASGDSAGDSADGADGAAASPQASPSGSPSADASDPEVGGVDAGDDSGGESDGDAGSPPAGVDPIAADDVAEAVGTAVQAMEDPDAGIAGFAEADDDAASTGESAKDTGEAAAGASMCLSRLLVVYVARFCASYGFSVMQTTYPLLIAELFGWGSVELGVVLLGSGIVIVVTQLGIVPRVTTRFGKHGASIVGLLLLSAGLISYPLLEHPVPHLLAYTAHIVGFSLSSTGVTSLASRYAPALRQGTVLGTVESFSNLANVVAPAISGELWDLSVTLEGGLGGGLLPYVPGSGMAALSATFLAGLLLRSRSAKRASTDA